mgnify:CR=1 FL=1
MKTVRLLVVGTMLCFSMACSNRVATTNTGIMETHDTELDPADLVMAGYARAPGVQVRVLAAGCGSGSTAVVATGTSSTTGSFTADSTGQRGYSFSMNVDLVAAGYIPDYNEDFPYESAGCVKLAMQERVGSSWVVIALFDGTAADCRDRLLDSLPNATWFQQINACKIPVSWGTYLWEPEFS